MYTLVYIYILKIYYLIFLALVGLCCCTQAFSSCSEQGLLFVVLCGLLIAGWLLSLQSTGSRHSGFSSCSRWAQ